jgi:hypothetical protein
MPGSVASGTPVFAKVKIGKHLSSELKVNKGLRPGDADDVVIMGRRLQDVEDVCMALVEQTNKMGIEINRGEKKTKFVIESQKPYNGHEYIKLDRCNFEIVEDCTDHGTVLAK